MIHSLVKPNGREIKNNKSNYASPQGRKYKKIDTSKSHLFDFLLLSSYFSWQRTEQNPFFHLFLCLQPFTQTMHATYIWFMYHWIIESLRHLQTWLYIYINPYDYNYNTTSISVTIWYIHSNRCHLWSRTLFIYIFVSLNVRSIYNRTFLLR